MGPASSESGRPRPWVIGIGNELRRDDGAGVVAARLIRGQLRHPAEVREVDGAGLELLELWAGAPVAVALDAVRSAAPVGTVHRLEVGPAGLPAPRGATSTHGLSLSDTVALGLSLDRMPDRLVVYGIEVRDVATGRGLSAPVARALPAVADQVLADLEEAARA